MAVVVMEVASEFLQTYRSGKALRESDHPKRMGGAIVTVRPSLTILASRRPTREESPIRCARGNSATEITRNGSTSRR